MSNPHLIDIAKAICKEHVAPFADAVDRDARFPHEAITALKNAQLLSAYVPTSLGGASASLSELAEICEILGQHCASSAMIFAMHQIQLVTLVQHAMQNKSDWYREY